MRFYILKEEKGENFFSVKKAIELGLTKGFSSLGIELKSVKHSFINSLMFYFRKDTLLLSFSDKIPFKRKAILFIPYLRDFRAVKRFRKVFVFLNDDVSDCKDYEDSKIIKLRFGEDLFFDGKEENSYFPLPDKYLFFYGSLRYSRELSSFLNLLRRTKNFDFKIVFGYEGTGDISLFMNDTVKKGVYEFFQFVGPLKKEQFFYVLKNSSAFFYPFELPYNMFYLYIAYGNGIPIVSINSKKVKEEFEDYPFYFSEENFSIPDEIIKKKTKPRTFWKDIALKIIKEFEDRR